MFTRALSLTGLIAGALSLAACDSFTTSDAGDAGLDVPEVEAGEINQDALVDITRTMSADDFDGRMPGTPGGQKTIAYLIEKFEAAGLQPGNGDSWVQEVPLVEITGGNYAPLTITNGETDLVYDFGSEWVGVSYRTERQIQLANSELVFVGYGINAPERGWNDYEGIDVMGKTVVMLVNDPDWQSADLEGTFNGRAMTYYGRWTYKFEEAARQGAAAALVVHDTEPASYGWNVVENGWSGPQAYAARGDNAPPMTQMNGWVQQDVAREILKAAGQDFDALAQAAKEPEFNAVELGLAASTSFSNEMRTFTSANVIGILPGTDAPDEYVMHTAHWDHLGRCSPAPDGDDICNGAIDNATGTSAIIAIAEAHAKAGAPRRSTVYLAVTAEESGLLGADYYAANPVYPLDQTVSGINIDALQMTGPANDITVVGPGKSQLDLFLNAGLQAVERRATPNPAPEAGYYYRSDHFSFAKRGVPMLYLTGGRDLVDGGTAAGDAYAQDYRINKYHGPKDEFDEDWDWSGPTADVGLFYRLSRMMAMSTSWPNWNDGDEFKAARYASCAAAETGC